MLYALYYWPLIQGRGEFVRLALETAGADYVDVAREQGVAVLQNLMQRNTLNRPPFAPPFLRVGRELIGQTANILHYLGPHLGLAPESESGRRWAHQLQLTIEDLLVDVHDTHHPVSMYLYYEDQQTEAKRRVYHFVRQRAPELLGYFEQVLQANAGGRGYAVGRRLSYVDLSLFQVVAGLRYAFPNLMRQLEPSLPSLVGLHERIAQRPSVAAYLSSPRRIPFNREGIFRHYPELDYE